MDLRNKARNTPDQPFARYSWAQLSRHVLKGSLDTGLVLFTAKSSKQIFSLGL